MIYRCGHNTTDVLNYSSNVAALHVAIFIHPANDGIVVRLNNFELKRGTLDHYFAFLNKIFGVGKVGRKMRQVGCIDQPLAFDAVADGSWRFGFHFSPVDRSATAKSQVV